MDRSNGYEAVAGEFLARRGAAGIGAANVRAWGRSLPKGADVLDLGCGDGGTIARVLLEDGFVVHGVDASVTMVEAFRRRWPGAAVACEAVEDSTIFSKRFDGVVAWGLMFLVTAEAQRALIGKVAEAIRPGGRFYFTAPETAGSWVDVLTGRRSISLGAKAYRAALAEVGLTVVREERDEGDNHAYDAVRV